MYRDQSRDQLDQTPTLKDGRASSHSPHRAGAEQTSDQVQTRLSQHDLHETTPWTADDSVPLEDAIEAIFHFPPKSKSKSRSRSRSTTTSTPASVSASASTSTSMSMSTSTSTSTLTSTSRHQIQASQQFAAMMNDPSTSPHIPAVQTTQYQDGWACSSEVYSSGPASHMMRQQAGNLHSMSLAMPASCNPTPTSSPPTNSSTDTSGTSRGWTEDEHQRFLVALRDYCPDAETRVAQDGRVRVGLGRGVAYFISRAIGTKTASQVRSHAQKYFEGLMKD
ncbi:hypothetical protein GUITHDRAFT_114316 [Guillardia theta CCMP2712]|uniref:Myb-like domain-containing protein n=1 Tax=Guillardia theta (strain CCMP2712) TaxID=905079 RepID=L1IUS2_GUITC|nr:hypothetical protein GUITHDRAFT_114316 [Guillardia theta CCMP2712]EKX39590.1 hypothetical protein GUITHDRAFT_114316 [Guillardia theta CCMP2712]|eukprot:XP_005826570.1 hypothetical protein GUITHDRAFT_114316 [Guillardia theta CCMP2712]